MREEVIAKILEEKIIAIVRGVGAEECMKVAKALYEGGIRLMEITFDQKNPASFQDNLLPQASGSEKGRDSTRHGTHHGGRHPDAVQLDRKSTRLNSSHSS